MNQRLRTITKERDVLLAKVYMCVRMCGCVCMDEWVFLDVYIANHPPYANHPLSDALND